MGAGAGADGVADKVPDRPPKGSTAGRALTPDSIVSGAGVGAGAGAVNVTPENSDSSDDTGGAGAGTGAGAGAGTPPPNTKPPVDGAGAGAAPAENPNRSKPPADTGAGAGASGAPDTAKPSNIPAEAVAGAGAETKPANSDASGAGAGAACVPMKSKEAGGAAGTDTSNSISTPREARVFRACARTASVTLEFSAISSTSSQLFARCFARAATVGFVAKNSITPSALVTIFWFESFNRSSSSLPINAGSSMRHDAANLSNCSFVGPRKPPAGVISATRLRSYEPSDTEEPEKALGAGAGAAQPPPTEPVDRAPEKPPPPDSELIVGAPYEDVPLEGSRLDVKPYGGGMPMGAGRPGTGAPPDEVVVVDLLKNPLMDEPIEAPFFLSASGS